MLAPQKYLVLLLFMYNKFDKQKLHTCYSYAIKLMKEYCRFYKNLTDSFFKCWNFIKKQ